MNMELAGSLLFLAGSLLLAGSPLARRDYLLKPAHGCDPNMYIPTLQQYGDFEPECMRIMMMEMVKMKMTTMTKI